MLRDLIVRNRSYRRFDQQQSISEETLRELVDLARLSASASNMQPLKFLLACTPEANARIFPYLAWAGYLKDWGGPAEGERPTAYIIIVGDKRIRSNAGVDHGIAAQSILLGATEKGLGGCMIGAIQRGGLAEELALPEHYEILLVLALGVPAEEVVLEETGSDGDIHYYRDDQDRHHVPKRPLNELIIEVV